MLPFEAAVTFAMNALCLAANSGLFNLDDLLTSERGDSEPVGEEVAPLVTPVLELVLVRKLRLELLGSSVSIVRVLYG